MDDQERRQGVVDLRRHAVLIKMVPGGYVVEALLAREFC
jgi:hypothetical protein